LWFWGRDSRSLVVRPPTLPAPVLSERYAALLPAEPRPLMSRNG
jgi:hypothetical protein